MESKIKNFVEEGRRKLPLEDGTVYSRRKGVQPFSVSPLQDYIPIVGEERIEKLEKLARKLEGIRMVEFNSTMVGGGVAEMLYSQVPFLNELGIEDEWKVVHGTEAFYLVTKNIHNLLQGKKGTLTSEMVRRYYRTLKENADIYAKDHERYKPDIVIVHDPQPLGLARYLKGQNEKWLWRFHIDVEGDTLEANPVLWQFITFWASFYDAVMFSGAHYVVDSWPLRKYISPPFIDPLSIKNKELRPDEITKVLEKYEIDQSIPLLVQIGRFDPWKGIDTTIKAYKIARKEEKCQLVVAGNMASDDPEGERIFNHVCEETRSDSGIQVIRLPDDVAVNALEVNALQRAARVILQPSTKEGFGLVITEAMWKGKPVITREVGAIPIQIRDGETGFFITTAKKAAKKIIRLLRDPEQAESVGREAHEYVKEHFLMPDRVADYLRVANYFINDELDRDSIISYHPWFKLSKRKS
ncbi:MAG: glycosyl transferase family 1 [Chloroflexi bacterium CG23_combo_of_CG06-09_8_20_14_all_45_10]|nr:MAG: glycosyl transferase family 1 [Chloroflexi bacterium CG23_combo_of_CG06-09_8_20_14_all_45_10]